VCIPSIDRPIGQLSLPAVLEHLQGLGIRSVMVEGGARVIRSFLSASASTSSGLVDSIIVTVAPMFVGEDGVGYSYESVPDEVSSFCLFDAFWTLNPFHRFPALNRYLQRFLERIQSSD